MMPPQVKPEAVCGKTGNGGNCEPKKQVELSSCSKRACGQQPWQRREWQPQLLHKHGSKYEGQAVFRQELKRFIHTFVSQ